MHRAVTVLVVVVVAAIALAAGIDALSGGSAAQRETEPLAASTTSRPTSPMLDADLGGTLYFTNADCELRAIELPRQIPAEAPNWDECRFVLSPHATSVSGAGTAWDPTGDHLFHARDGRIVVLSSDHEPEGDPFRGTAPAWRPDGTLTYFADGAYRAWPDGGMILSQRDLVRAMRTGPVPELRTRYRRFQMREATWLDDRRLAAILSARSRIGDEDMLAVYDGARLEEFYFDELGGFSDLRRSPTGRHVAVNASEQHGLGGFLLISPGGGTFNDPGIVGYRAIAWSPDEQWVAVAAESRVLVFQPGSRGPPELELDLDAYDLEWRGAAGRLRS